MTINSSRVIHCTKQAKVIKPTLSQTLYMTIYTCIRKKKSSFYNKIYCFKFCFLLSIFIYFDLKNEQVTKRDVESNEYKTHNTILKSCMYEK